MEEVHLDAGEVQIKVQRTGPNNNESSLGQKGDHVPDMWLLQECVCE